ncbi:uncharacterized protein V1513DRAFT_467019 [Lipomyces chichibuensis]|uniref:uncharacterized protein n=1 Tax=Lipomyces chichibuensis TaxID=1546026 RepID=UPI003343F843
MDSSSTFAAVSLRASRGFSWVFLVELIVTGIATIFVLFYFNRVIAAIMSLSLRWYTWHRYHVFIDIRSIQVSLLAGRIFFKDVRYIGSNESIFVVQGHFTWRYWLNRTRKSGLKLSDKLYDKNSVLPARFVLYMEGVEWFVYNRTPAYDAALHEYEVANGLGDYDLEDNGAEVHPLDLNRRKRESASSESSLTARGASPGQNKTRQDAPHVVPNSEEKGSMILKFFPVEIKCDKGAMVVGNFRTPNIMIYHFASAAASVDAARSRSELDQYKMVFDLDFNRPSIQFRANMDYQGPSTDANNYGSGNEKQESNRTDLSKTYKRSKWRSFVDLFAFLHGRFPTGIHGHPGQDDAYNGQWHGLSRYLDDEEMDQVADSEQVEEYAKCTSVLDADEARLTYYYDVVGKVPMGISTPVEKIEGADIGNGGQAPQWGIDLYLRGATIQYGPWADRQRLILQSMFFPAAKINSEPRENLQLGEDRVATEFKVYVEMDDSTILRVPIREPSRDAEFKRRKEEAGSANLTRSFGWIELKMSQLSTVTHVSALVPSKNGWLNWMTADLNSLDMRSSVNHDILWSAKSHKIRGDLTSPLQWNGLQTWIFDNDASSVEAFLLREHVTIFTDMISDFSSVPDTTYASFIPQKFLIKLSLSNFSLYLNVNDSNIISNPTDFDDNIFLGFGGAKLDANIVVPLDQISPIVNEVRFRLNAEVIDFLLHAPPWHTQASFLPSKNLGKAKDFELVGSYTFTESPRSLPIDTLSMDLSTGSISLIAYGFLIRYLIKIRENYFGDNIHFKTLDEFTKSAAATDYLQNGIKTYRYSSESILDGAATASRGEKEPLSGGDILRPLNSMDVLVSFKTNSGTLILPTNIYSAKSHLRMDMDLFDVDLRFTNYYMDLQMNISPMQGNLLELPEDQILIAQRHEVAKVKPELFIDGISVFGHRMFGLPPSEPTYICNWDFDLGIVFTEGTPKLYEGITDALSAFLFTFSDKENALIVTEPPLYDATLLRMKMPCLRMLIHNEKSTLELITEEISVTLNDLGTDTYNSRIALKVPIISFLCRDRFQDAEASRVLAYLTTSLYVTNFDRKKNGKERLRLQQEHIRKHDHLFNRVPFFLMSELENDTTVDLDEKELAKIPITLPMPQMPPPLVVDRSVPLPWNDSTGKGAQSIASSSAESLSSVIHHDLSNIINRESFNGRSYLDIYNATCKNSEAEQKINFTNTFMPFHSCVAAFRDLEFVKNGYEREIYEMDESMIQSDLTSMRPLDNSNTGYDSFVVEFRGGIDGFLSPFGAEAIVDVLDSLSQPDVSSMLDGLQIDVLERLESNLMEVSLVTSARIVVPGLHIRYGIIENSLTDCSMVPDKISMGDHIDLEIKAVTLSLRASDESEKALPEQSIRRKPVHRVWSVCFNLFQMTVGLVRVNDEPPEQRTTALELQIERIEAWNRGTEKTAASFKIRSAGFIVQNQDVKWIVHSLINALEQVKPIREKAAVISGRKENRMKNLVYLIAVASNAYEISHDPAFLTRPAYVLRSSKSHIRANDSWKLMARLRHIYRELPADICTGLKNDLSVDDILPPTDAKAKSIRIMSDWRSWEMVDIGTSYIFAHVFDGERRIVEPVCSAISFFLDVETITIYIANGTEQEDYLQLSYLTFSISSKSAQTKDPAKTLSYTSVLSGQQQRDAMQTNRVDTKNIFEVSAGCEEVRIITNWSSLSLIQDVNSVLDGRSPTAVESVEPELPVMATALINESRLSREKPDIECHSVIAIKSFISVFNSKNFRVQASGHNIQSSMVGFSSNSDYTNAIPTTPPSSILLRATAFELDLLGPNISGERRLLTLGIQRSDIWISVPTLAHPVEIRSYVRVNELLFEMIENSIGLSVILGSIVTCEVEQFSQLFPKLRVNAPETNSGVVSQPVSLADPVPSDKVAITLDLRNYQFVLNLLPSLKYIIRGSAVQIISTPIVNGVRSVAFEAGEQVHEFRQRKKYRESMITSTKFPKVTTLIRIETVDKITRVVDVRINMHTVNFDASSFPTLASVLSGDVTKAELLRAQQEWIAAVNLLELHKPYREQSKVPVVRNLRLRGSLYIKGVMIKAEYSDSQIIMSIDDIKVEGSSATDGSIDNLVSRMSVLGELPKISITVVNTKFKSGRFQVLDTNLMLSCKIVDDKAGGMLFKHAVAVKNDTFRFEISPYSATLIVEILSQFEERLTNIELPEEIFHLTTKLKDVNSQMPADIPPKVQTWDGIFQALIRVQLQNGSFHWVADDFADDANGSFHMIVQSDIIRFASKGEGFINISICGFAVMAKEMNPQLNSAECPKILSESSSVIPEISIRASLKHDGSNRALGLAISSSEVHVKVIPSVVKVANAITSSVSKTTNSVLHKIDDYKRRSAAHNELLTSNGNLAEPPTVLTKVVQRFFSSANVSADFAGATIELIGNTEEKYTEEPLLGRRAPTFTPKPDSEFGKQKQTQEETGPVATLRVPGVHMLMDYLSASRTQSICGEILIESSINKLDPRVMPVAMEMVKYLQDTMREPKEVPTPADETVVALQKDVKSPVPASEVLGNIELNFSLRFGRQEFTLSCEPIAKVAANTVVDELYLTLNTFHKTSSTRFFSCAMRLLNMRASLQHIYSRESSAQIAIEELTVAALSSQKLSRETGLSFVGKVNEVLLDLNIKQSHDLLLFQDIWSPDLTLATSHPKKTADQRAELLVQRYHRVASTNAFPWNVDFELTNLKGGLDLGQSLGKLAFGLDKGWLASRKSSDWEQNLTFGLCHFSSECKGRLGGELTVDNIRARSAIRWQVLDDGRIGVPLVQVSAGVEALNAKLYFDYRLFLIATGHAMHLTMFNQRGNAPDICDRLVCIADCNAVKVYVTVLAPSNILAILTAIARLDQDRAAAYQAVLRDSEAFKLTENVNLSEVAPPKARDDRLVSIGLRTELNLSIKTVIVNAFPSALSDSEVLRVEAMNAHATFGIDVESSKIRSNLELMLGQFLVALSSTKGFQEDLNLVTVEKFVQHTGDAKGGIIMRVPAVSVSMKTWQPIGTMTTVEFIFRSIFEGRVEVGWNLGLINFIRDMWNTHVRSFQVRKAANADGTNYGSHLLESEELEKKIKDVELNKSYTYIPLEPPVIATPQLRDMGEATPPLEWIGLNRDRFPGLTHQAIIIPLQSMSRKVEMAYSNVLGKA